ncbi:MAG: OmpA family protein [Cytophagales bacterium]|jgi:outer membrane protein OmpA-like peptidoglycan-associated protein/tetratricopeptide (TPR) repeat protein|nr:OmpA family protein [Cytophagales bacterium]
MRKKRLLAGVSLALALLAGASVSAQTKSPELEKKIKKADALLTAKEYRQAIPLYLELDKAVPNDPANHYALGLCYAQVGESQKALPYLKAAIESKSQDVPNKVHYWYGKALHLGGRFDEAIASLNEFRQSDNNVELVTDAAKLVQQCNVAKALTAKPEDVFVQPVDAVNTPATEYGPVISADESVLVYTTIKKNTATGTAAAAKEYEDVMITRKTGGQWSAPQSAGIPTPVVGGVRSNIGSVGLSPDGQKLLVYIGTTANSADIYASTLQGDKWGPPSKLGREVNSTYQESSASFTPDEKVVYFASSRPGGLGGLDIYKAERQTDGSWGAPVNLGPTVNSKYDEEAPFIHPDKKTLYFTSNGPNAMGGTDVFRTVLDKGRWTTPANLGSPINSVYNDSYFAISADGKKGYFSSDRPGGKGGGDIYFLGIPEELGVVALTMMKGRILAGNPAKPVKTSIKVIDKVTGEVIKGVYSPNAKTGDYLIIFPPNRQYDMVIEAEGFKPSLVNIYVPNQDYFYEMYQEILLTPVMKDGKVVGQGIAVKNAFEDTDKDKSSSNNDNVYALMGKILTAEDSLALGALLESVYSDPGTDIAAATKDQKATEAKYIYSESKMQATKVGNETVYTLAAVDTKAAANAKKEVITQATVLKPNQVYIVYFDTDKADLKADAKPELDKVFEFLKKNPSYGVRIAGHTDNSGTPERNLTISENRAKAVVGYLAAKGIAAKRTSAKGYGQTEPLNANSNEEEKKKNRRVEITLGEMGQDLSSN